jgi:ferrous iron transport protein B
MTDTLDPGPQAAAAPADTSARRSPGRRIALVGLPNSGKSQIFNRLTGKYAVVANYPMTTVTAERKPALIGGHWYEVVDTPGLHGLTIHAEEELEVRELLYRERPDVIVQCVDANRLKASLSLTADLLELEVPLVVALNAIDETTRRGVQIDARLLAERLGVQVVELVAAKGLGTGKLRRAITAAAPGIQRKRYGDLLEAGLERILRALPRDIPYPRKTALTLAVGGPFLLAQLGRWYPHADLTPLRQELAAFRASFRANPATATASVRNRWVDAIANEVVRTRPPPRGDWSRRAAAISRHPVLGAPVLLGITGVCFLLVVQVANRLTDLLNTWVWGPVAAGLDSVLAPGLWHDLLLGEFGLISFGVANALLTVLPILSVFFFAYSLIEDTGYIPNMGVMTQRALRKLGLSGSSIMPLVLACGCKTMATMTTRVLTSRKERLIAVFLIASSIPCAAQTGLHLAILGRTGLGATGLVAAVMLAGFVVSGVLLNRILKDDRPPEFIQALPPMRMPSLKAVLLKTYYRVLWFCREALPVFVIAAGILFVADKVGLLGALRGALAPVIEGFLGLPPQMVDVLILCIARQEAAAGMLLHLVEQGRLDTTQTIVAVVVALRFVPCFNNVVAMGKELGLASTVVLVVAINGSAVLLAGLVRWALQLA